MKTKDGKGQFAKRNGDSKEQRKSTELYLSPLTPEETKPSSVERDRSSAAEYPDRGAKRRSFAKQSEGSASEYREVTVLDGSPEERDRIIKALFGLRPDQSFQDLDVDTEEEGKTISISNEQKDLLVQYLPDAEKMIIEGDIDAVLDRLDDKITEIGFDREYELNEIGLQLQRLYDQLYNQN